MPARRHLSIWLLHGQNGGQNRTRHVSLCPSPEGRLDHFFRSLSVKRLDKAQYDCARLSQPFSQGSIHATRQREGQSQCRSIASCVVVRPSSACSLGPQIPYGCLTFVACTRKLGGASKRRVKEAMQRVTSQQYTQKQGDWHAPIRG